MEDLQVPMRIPEEGEETPDVVQPEFDPEPLEPIEMLEGGLVVHERPGKPTAGIKDSAMDAVAPSRRVIVK
jgi:hypothetical protein